MHEKFHYMLYNVKKNIMMSVTGEHLLVHHLVL